MLQWVVLVEVGADRHDIRARVSGVVASGVDRAADPAEVLEEQRFSAEPSATRFARRAASDVPRPEARPALHAQGPDLVLPRSYSVGIAGRPAAAARSASAVCTSCVDGAQNLQCAGSTKRPPSLVALSGARCPLPLVLSRTGRSRSLATSRVGRSSSPQPKLVTDSGWVRDGRRSRGAATTCQISRRS